MPRAQRYEDVKATAARCFREGGESKLVEDDLQYFARADGVGEFTATWIEVEREPIRITHRGHARVHHVHPDATDPDEAEEGLEVAADEIVHVLTGALRTQSQPRCPNRD